MSFAENLKQLRKERQLSQEELAEILDVSRQAVSKWEQGIGYPEVSKEIMEIHDAIVNGIATYTLKYSVRTKKRLLGIKIELE